MPRFLRRATLACTLLAPLAAWADGSIYLCTDAAGHKELTDRERPGCRRLDVPGAAVTVPAPRGGARRDATPPVTPADFPRIAASQQKARDDDRRAILEDELAAEQRKLTQLKAEYNNGEPERHGDERNYAKYQARVADMQESIARSEKNVEALKREIAGIR